MRKTFTTYDEEFYYADRIADEIRDFLQQQNLDTVNEIYTITVEIDKTEWSFSGLYS